jgi:acyl-CoA synthetase (NDP forming)
MAFAHLFAFRDHRALPPLESAPAIGQDVRDRWVDRLAAAEPLDEVDGLALLGDFGIPTTPTRRADDAEEAIAAAEEVGYPVAVKTRGAIHKADARGVHLNLGDDASVRRAYADLAGRLGPGVVVAAMGERGLELALGIYRDAQFGPLVLVAAGGTFVETIRDRALALPPLDRVRAARLIDRLSVRKSLRKDAVDLDAVLDAIVRVSVLALELGDFVDAIDVNPLLCGPRGCVAVDALVVPRSNR